MYNWADYFAPDTIARFTEETGIRVVYDVYDSDEMLQTRLLAGPTGYDLVFPGTAFAEEMLRLDLFRPLDPDATPNRIHIDAAAAAVLTPSDPGMRYGLPYTTALTGIAFDVRKIAERLPGARIERWSQVFDPKVVAALADCGVAVIDAPLYLFQAALRTLDLPVDSEDSEHLARAAARIEALRPALRYIGSGRIIGDLASGDICLAVTWTGDGLIAKARAREAGAGREIVVVVPQEGTVFQANHAMIPRDAPNPRAAERFIDYLHRPDVHADVVRAVNGGTLNRAAIARLPPAVAALPGVLIPEAQRATLWPARKPSLAATRLIGRYWSRLRSGF
jgi:putrescine transport system substrate-binding protein